MTVRNWKAIQAKHCHAKHMKQAQSSPSNVENQLILPCGSVPFHDDLLFPFKVEVFFQVDFNSLTSSK